MRKFKVGDKVNLIGRDDEIYNILRISGVYEDDNCYTCNQGTVIYFKDENKWRKVGDADFPNASFTQVSLLDLIRTLERAYGKLISNKHKNECSVFKDGNQWCYLLGKDIQEGICGFGETKEAAFIDFIKNVLDELWKEKESLT